jgi:superfamily II DNA helicase RecQ
MNLTRAELYELLKRHFNKDEFATGQAEVISNVISGKDVLAVKGHVAEYDICYMYSALLIDGIVIVVSRTPENNKSDNPLTKLHIPYSIIPDHFRKRITEIMDGKYKIVYTVPEHFRNKAFLFALSRIPISLMVVDDAQCLSQMRYDFNPSYLHISKAISDMDTRPTILALANTHKEKIQEDIMKQLQMDTAEIISLGYSFPDVAFEVISTNSAKEKLKLLGSLVKKLDGQGIIYVNQRNEVTEVFNFLQEIKPNIAEYHGGVSRDDRQKIERDFRSQKLKIIISTNYLSPKISDCAISYVIHAYMPDRLERYYDQISTIGQSDQTVRCVLLYSPSDREYHQSIIERGTVSLVDIWRVVDALKSYNTMPKHEASSKQDKNTLQGWLEDHYNGLTPKAKKELTRLKNLYENMSDQDKNPCPFDEYSHYLESDHWKDFSKARFDENEQCEVCAGKAKNTHHLTYKNIYKENPEDVVVLCLKCHCYIHPDNPMTQKAFAESVEADQNQFKLFGEDRIVAGQQIFIQHEKLELDSGLSRYRLTEALSEMQNAGMLEILPDCSLAARIIIKASKGELLSHVGNGTERSLIEWLLANLKPNERHDVNLLRLSNEISCPVDEIEDVFLTLNYNNAISYIPQQSKLMALLLYDLDIELSENTFERLKGERYESLKMMGDYIHTDQCRQAYIGQHILGDAIENCGKCDNCISPASQSLIEHIEESDVSNAHFAVSQDVISDIDRASIAILSCAEKIDGLLGRRDMVKMLIGQHTKRIRKYGFDHVEEFGYLADTPKNMVLESIDKLLELGCLQVPSLFFPMIQLTDTGRRRLRRIIASTESRKNKQFKGLGD